MFCVQEVIQNEINELEKENTINLLIFFKGNGLDTHRFYESVLMGAIPVVENSTLFPIYKETTVLVLDKFRNLKPFMLHNPLLYTTNMNFSKKILLLKTWTERIDLLKKVN